MGLPACAWDAGLGLLVLYRQPGAVDGGFSLVVAPGGGLPPWYAGELPADAPLWVIRVPADGAFRLLLYPAGAPVPLLGEPPPLADGTPAVLAFDARLRVDPERPPGARARYEGFLLRGAGAGPLPCAVRSFEVGGAETLAEVLGGDWDDQGITVFRAIDAGPLVLRGPAMHPLRVAGGGLDVHFTLVPDPPAAAADAVCTPAFAALAAPAIAVDLSAFGDAAEELRAGLWFFHHPHGPERGVAHWSGADLPLLTDEQGGRFLLFTADDACHLDLLGVATGGAPLLVPRADPALPLRGLPEPPAATDCLLMLYHGDAWLLPAATAAAYAALAREHCAPLDLAALTLTRDAAWLGERLHHGDWRGAQHAEAFTLAGFAYWRGRLDAVAGAALARHGIQTGAFVPFAARADLLCALLAEPALGRLLGRAAPAPGGLLAVGARAPVAALAATLEPDLPDLAAWVDGQGAEVQRALWRWLLAGGRARDWRALGIPAAATRGPDGSPLSDAALADLVARLAGAWGADPGGALAATAADLDLPLPAPGGFTAALARADALAGARAVLAEEVSRVNGELGALPDLTPLGLAPVLAGLGAALAGDGVAAPEVLRGRLLSALGGRGPQALELAATVTDLRTRGVLLALAGRLGVGAAPAPEAGAAIMFAPPAAAPPGPGAAPSAPAPDPVAAAPAADRPPVTPPATPGDALRWCLATLQRAEASWPPAAGPVPDLAQGLADCAALLADLDAWWGLTEAQPVAAPRWTGPQADQARAMIAAIASQGWQVRGVLEAAQGDPVADRLRGVLDRIVAAREYLVADALWAGIRGRLAALPEDGPLAALRGRADLAGPDQWPALAAALGQDSPDG